MDKLRLIFQAKKRLYEKLKVVTKRKCTDRKVLLD